MFFDFFAFYLYSISFRQIFSSSQFCSVLYTKIKHDKCPNPTTFNVIEESLKSPSSWKLNIPVREFHLHFRCYINNETE